MAIYDDVIGVSRFKDNARMQTTYTVDMLVEKMANADAFKQHIYKTLITQLVDTFIKDCYEEIKRTINMDELRKRVEDQIVESMADYLKEFGKSLAKESLDRQRYLGR